MSETGPPKGMQTPNTGTHDAALAKKAQEARGSSKVDEVLAATGAMGQAISTEVQKVIIGKSHVIDNVMVDILSNGNLLFEDFPGLAKTLMTNTFADFSLSPQKSAHIVNMLCLFWCTFFSNRGIISI